MYVSSGSETEMNALDVKILLGVCDLSTVLLGSESCHSDTCKPAQGTRIYMYMDLAFQPVEARLGCADIQLLLVSHAAESTALGEVCNVPAQNASPKPVPAKKHRRGMLDTDVWMAVTGIY